MGFTEFQEEVLEKHNEYRAQHSAEPLELDYDICQYAQEWADVLASRNVMQHRTNGKYGENLYAMYGRTDPSADDVVGSWYNEIEHYSFGAPQPHNFSQVGHFTQVVWQNSSKLGVGIATCGSNVYVVCNYDPRGNYMGDYHLNVSED